MTHSVCQCSLRVIKGVNEIMWKVSKYSEKAFTHLCCYILKALLSAFTCKKLWTSFGYELLHSRLSDFHKVKAKRVANTVNATYLNLHMIYALGKLPKEANSQRTRAWIWIFPSYGYPIIDTITSSPPWQISCSNP